ncbi:hypothetical protein BGX38DRAFT_1143356 [Terfezia claveryi]|nr:hypothetical protein BGX38DRAFT_1143356 [Terfezia claveryi]
MDSVKESRKGAEERIQTITTVGTKDRVVDRSVATTPQTTWQKNTSGGTLCTSFHGIDERKEIRDTKMCDRVINGDSDRESFKLQTPVEPRMMGIWPWLTLRTDGKMCAEEACEIPLASGQSNCLRVASWAWPIRV